MANGAAEGQHQRSAAEQASHAAGQPARSTGWAGGPPLPPSRTLTREFLPANQTKFWLLHIITTFCGNAEQLDKWTVEQLDS